MLVCPSPQPCRPTLTFQPCRAVVGFQTLRFVSQPLRQILRRHCRRRHFSHNVGNDVGNNVGNNVGQRVPDFVRCCLERFCDGVDVLTAHVAGVERVAECGDCSCGVGSCAYAVAMAGVSPRGPGNIGFGERGEFVEPSRERDLGSVEARSGTSDTYKRAYDFSPLGGTDLETFEALCELGWFEYLHGNHLAWGV